MLTGASRVSQISYPYDTSTRILPEELSAIQKYQPERPYVWQVYKVQCSLELVKAADQLQPETGFRRLTIIT